MVETKTISESDFNKIRATSKIIEESGRTGIKIMRLQDGRYMKFFRIRHLISSARIWPYHDRFAKNAKKLTELGFKTVSVDSIIKIPEIKRTAVIYQPVEGFTLRQLFANGKLTPAILSDFGNFTQILHVTGINFDSLHLGNIILQEDGTFGIIDMTDMSFEKKPLRPSACLSNIARMLRYKEDVTAIFEVGADSFVDGYCKSLPENEKSDFSSCLHALLKEWKNKPQTL